MRTDLAESLPAERVRPAGTLPPGHRFETGTQLLDAIRVGADLVKDRVLGVDKSLQVVRVAHPISQTECVSSRPNCSIASLDTSKE